MRGDMRPRLAWICAGFLVLPGKAGSVVAQAPGPSDKLARMLPVAAAERVQSRVEEARARGLPAATLEQRALELSAKGIAPDRVAEAIDEYAERLDSARLILRASGRGEAADEEIDAAATALRKGLASGALGDLAQSAPSGRSLAVPLLVISSLMDRGLPADAALRQVHARLSAWASDQQLAGLALPQGLNAGQARALTGQGFAASKRPSELGSANFVPAGALTTGSHPATPVRPPGRERP